MGKEIYTFETKLAMVKLVLEEGCGRKEVSRKYFIPNTTIDKWVNLYLHHGVEGLLSRNRVTPQEDYSAEYKLNVLKYMEDNNLSYSKTAIIYCIDTVTVSKWAKRYREGGVQALAKYNHGKDVPMDNKRVERRPKKTPTKDERALNEEISRLRMENAYLKKLNALVRERVQRESGKK